MMRDLDKPLGCLLMLAAFGAACAVGLGLMSLWVLAHAVAWLRYVA